MRLIDADELREWWLECGENEYVYATNSFLDSIDNASTINAEPIKYANWTYKDFAFTINYPDGVEVEHTNLPVCSGCGFYSKTFQFATKRCPNCGAKMKGN